MARVSLMIESLDAPNRFDHCDKGFEQAQYSYRLKSSSALGENSLGPSTCPWLHGLFDTNLMIRKFTLKFLNLIILTLKLSDGSPV